jgi:hypothetical protein
MSDLPSLVRASARPHALARVGGQARPVAEEPGTIYRCRCARSCVMSSICPAAKPSNR